jgi:hypothetical protein
MPKPKVRHVTFSPEEIAYDLSPDVELSSWVPVIGRGVHGEEMKGRKPLKATYAVVDGETVSFSLDDGRKVSAPLDWYPRLQHATPAERNDWRLISGGRIVLWRSLEIAIAVKALLDGTKADESPAAFGKWLHARKGRHARKTA